MTQEGWTWAQVPDQTGRVAVVTGATSGTGFEAARILAACRATVVLACRNLPKAEEAARRIRALHPGARVEVQALDLASLVSVRRAAAELPGPLRPPGPAPQQRRGDGPAPWEDRGRLRNPARHQPLRPLRPHGPPAGAPAGHAGLPGGDHEQHRPRSGRIYADDMDFEGGYRAWAAYGQSKLANLLFAYELQRRLAAAGATTCSVAAHPGWARTELQRHAEQTGGPRGSDARALDEACFSQDAFGGAQPLLRAATDPSVTGGEPRSLGLPGAEGGARAGAVHRPVPGRGPPALDVAALRAAHGGGLSDLAPPPQDRGPALCRRRGRGLLGRRFLSRLPQESPHGTIPPLRSGAMGASATPRPSGTIPGAPSAASSGGTGTRPPGSPCPWRTRPVSTWKRPPPRACGPRGWATPRCTWTWTARASSRTPCGAAGPRPWAGPGRAASTRPSSPWRRCPCPRWWPSPTTTTTTWTRAPCAA